MLSSYSAFALVAIVSWGVALVLLVISLIGALRKYHEQCVKLTYVFIFIGFVSVLLFTCGLWIELERPPMRTAGETRLWYAIFILVISSLVYYKWPYKILLAGGVWFALMFVSINLLHPELLNKNLPPALQSIWFIPHVSVYMLAYSILGMSCLTALVGLVTKKYEQHIRIADDLVGIGFGFLTLGMTFGAFWAKEAWGHYWAWDPKETWAMITWLSYMLYIHYRLRGKRNIKQAMYLLVVAFVLLLICWFGINYLASAEGSVHVYN